MSERPRPIEITDPVDITVNGETFTVQKGELVIDACERNGSYIPRFCYHPRMNPVGMCRMCLVEIDAGRGPALQPSCMINVTPDMSVNTESDAVAKAQDGVLEFLLANHPLDCPVCDKGGECPLQDQTMAYGPGESRWVEEKRHYEKPIAISETVYLDRERCILCDRCTRFASEVADDPLIHFMGRGSGTEVNTFPDEPFSSYFSGNTVQICPVGALTAKPYRFRARPWDLDEVESTCTNCSVGCRITVESSRNQLLRFQGVDSDPVNWSWLCDKGRFSFEAINSPARVTEPLVRDGDDLVPARWSEALSAAAGTIRAAIDSRGPASVAVIGGARLTNESAYAWARLAKSIIGTDNVDAQLGDGLPADVVVGLPGATIDDVCRPGGTVLYFGPDPKEELPVLFLRLKHAAVNDRTTIIELTPATTGLTPYAKASLHPRSGELAAVVRAVVTGEVPTDGVGPLAADELRSAADLVASAGGPVTVVIGRPNLAESADLVVAAIDEVRSALPDATFLPALRRGNVRGALEAGLAPGRLPGRMSLTDGSETWSTVWGSVPAEPGLDTIGILEAAATGSIEVLILLGSDPLNDVTDRSLARRGLAGAKSVIVVDPFVNESGRSAQIVLPVAAFSECSGTTTSLEGRVTVLDQKVTPPGTARTDWVLAADLAQRLGGDLGVHSSHQELWAELVANSPAHSGVDSAALAAPDAVDGIVLSLTGAPVAAREPLALPAQNAYSLRLVLSRVLYDGGTLLSQSPSSAGLARTQSARLSPADASPLGVVDGQDVKLTSAHGSLTLPAVIDKGVPRGSVALVHNVTGGDATTLMSASDAVCDVRVEVI
ncbi:MAG: NADH-quinone oxidoreductase subunit NuoG [Acidimicrobiales bacterium]